MSTPKIPYWLDLILSPSFQVQYVHLVHKTQSTGFIYVFSRKRFGLHMEAKIVEWNIFEEKPFSRGSNQTESSL